MLMQFFRGPMDAQAWASVLSGLLGLAIALTIHEFAHAKAAEFAGDDTPRRHGRVTLNPLAHYDLIGSTLILLWGFGWGKPVPINPLAFRNPRRDGLLVSLWGPLSNFLTAALFAIPLRLGIWPLYAEMFVIIVLINLMLGVFNLIPIAPLDGSHILEALLPDAANRRLAFFYQRNQRWLMLAFLIVFLVPQVGDKVFLIVRIPVMILMRLLTGL